MKKIFVVSILVLSVLLLAGSPAYALKINITPPRVELSIAPGEEKMGHITITNFDKTGSMRVKVYVQDLVYLPDGSNDFLPPNSTPWSFADWIKVGPTELDIAPGNEAVVRYLISVPKDVKGGRYGVIFFEVVVPPSKVREVGASVTMRLGSIILVTLEGTEVYQARIANIKTAKPKGDKPFSVSCTVENQGNILVRPHGTVKIIDEDKNQIAELGMNTDKGGVLPGTSRKFTVEYESKLPKGIYYAQVVLDYGGEKLLGGQVKFRI